MARFLGTPKVQYFQTGTADFLEGGLLYSYEPNSLTPRATYPTLEDALAQTNANTNPVQLDARGEAAVVISGATKLILKDSDGNTIWTENNVESSSPTIYDSNGNEILKLVGVASAQNELTITNAASGSGPSIAATGDDTNVGMIVTSKGSGTMFIDAGATGSVVIGNSSTGSIQLKRTTAVTGNATVSGTLTVTGTGTFNAPDTYTQGFHATAIESTGTLYVNSTTILNDIVTCNSGIVISATSGTSFLRPGVVVMTARNSATPPNGWLYCDGAAISRTTYSALFAEIGTNYGVGDGSTTFNVPNCQRRVPVGEGGSAVGSLGTTVGSVGGNEQKTLSNGNLPANIVTASGSVVDTGATAGAVQVIGGTGSAKVGSATAFDLLQPSIIFRFMIRAY